MNDGPRANPQLYCVAVEFWTSGGAVHRPENAACLLALAISACVNVKPVVVDRRAQLENQLLGRLPKLEAELILLSSVRGAAPRKSISPWQQEAADAAMRRAFNADDVIALKRDGRVGETMEGTLQILQLPRDTKGARWTRQLVGEENHDRVAIMRRLIQLSPELSAKDLPLVRTILHRLLLRSARPGHRIQQPDGRWIVVPSDNASEL